MIHLGVEDFDALQGEGQSLVGIMGGRLGLCAVYLRCSPLDCMGAKEAFMMHYGLQIPTVLYLIIIQLLSTHKRGKRLLSREQVRWFSPSHRPLHGG